MARLEELCHWEWALRLKTPNYFWFSLLHTPGKGLEDILLLPLCLLLASLGQWTRTPLEL